MHQERDGVRRLTGGRPLRPFKLRASVLGGKVLQQPFTVLPGHSAPLPLQPAPLLLARPRRIHVPIAARASHGVLAVPKELHPAPQAWLDDLILHDTRRRALRLRQTLPRTCCVHGEGS